MTLGIMTVMVMVMVTVTVFVVVFEFVSVMVKPDFFEGSLSTLHIDALD